MRLINIILLFALVITSRFVVAPKSGATQEPEWKRILVLKSTRSDVEKLIGKSKEQGYMAYYPLKEGSVHIEYWDSVCQPGQNDG